MANTARRRGTSATVATLNARITNALRRRAPQSEIDGLRAERTAAMLEADIQHALSIAPPLTPEQRARLAAMLAPTHVPS